MIGRVKSLWQKALTVLADRRFQRAPRVLLEADNLLIRWLPGRGTRLVIVVSSYKDHERAARRLEFAGSASANGQNHVLFVTDLGMGWYSHGDILQRIADNATKLCRKLGVTEVVAVGGSMGGYGAMALAGVMAIDRVAAFAPQILLTDEVLSRPAWDDKRHRINLDRAVRDLRPIIARGQTKFTIVFGDQYPNDLLQTASLQAFHDVVDLVIMPGVGHDCARFLKKAGLLTDVVTAIMAGDIPLVRSLCQRAAASLPPGSSNTQIANDYSHMRYAGDPIHDQI